MPVGENKIERAGQWLFIALIAPILVVLVIAALPLVLLALIVDWLRSRLYCIQNSGAIYLVIDGRHGWRELIQNNLLPALPSQVLPVWFDSENSRNFRNMALRTFHPQRPFLVLLTPKGPRGFSIHDRLYPFKADGKRDEQIQKNLKIIITAAVDELKTIK